MGERQSIILYKAPGLLFTADDHYTIMESIKALQAVGCPTKMPQTLRSFEERVHVTLPMHRSKNNIILSPTNDVRFIIETDDYVGFRQAIPEIRKERFGRLYPLSFHTPRILLLPERIVYGLEHMDWETAEVAGLCSAVNSFDKPSSNVQTYPSDHYLGASSKLQ